MVHCINAKTPGFLELASSRSDLRNTCGGILAHLRASPAGNIMKDFMPWHRRHAVHLASQLPEDPEDALAVLALTVELVERFLAVPQTATERPAAALSFVAASRSRSRNPTGSPVSSPS